VNYASKYGTSDSNAICRTVCQLTVVPVLSDVVVTFLSSIVVLAANGLLLGCASTALEWATCGSWIAQSVQWLAMIWTTEESRFDFRQGQ